MPKKVALFVDVESLHQHLRTAHNRPLDPALVAAAARARGDVVAAAALADWGELPPDLAEAFAAEGVPPVQVDRAARTRDVGGRRRDVVRDLVDLEVLARIIEVLFPAAGGPEVDVFVLATADDAAVRAIQVTRERFQKEVVVVSAEGALSDALRAAAAAAELLPMPPIEPRDLEGLAQLVPLLEDLERRKRYLNFKYIRETVVRRLERVERSFDAAERLLSDAIGCGLLLKQKVEDKYNPGQLFTAYCLDRSHELFQRHGSGEPAPLHEDAPPAEGEGEGEGGEAAATPTLARNGARRPSRAASPARIGGRRRAGQAARARGPRRTTTTTTASSARPRAATRTATGAPQAPALVGGLRPRPQASRSRASQRRGGRGCSAGRGAPGQDRLGARYEAPSRFLHDEEERPPVQDDEIDEERILRARGDQ
ncbi:MAG: NYN domain-containing protein [Planctomycetes bacterium]|nr:NYN domain-containing protein [Planctomycetota bacterium]